ncbi:MAG: UvrD-helicase domain-containing protein [Bacteroidota bacterium]
MRFLADLHVHSHFSRATSGDCRPGPLAAAAARKGLTIVGTGDCTHGGWREELRKELIEGEEGLYRLREAVGPTVGIRFLVSGEISCIYKQDGRTRKIHHVVLLPSLAAAEKFSASLEARGANLRADGRPIIGLDSRTLLALMLDAEPRGLLIPAHIWTPHFSLFGAHSGFDALEECFGDLSSEVIAFETGLSSDPPMNWRLSALDRLTLVSNSDAHSPDKLGREAVEIEAELSYGGLTAALRRNQGQVLGTVEFYPEEGKYHYDGHRNCGVCWHPSETAAAGGRCRVCGRPVTVGVLHRVTALADRPEKARPAGAPQSIKLVPLAETVAAAFDVGTTSRRVQETYRRLIDALGPEIPLLRAVDLGEIDAVGGTLVAEAVRRVRAGEVEFRPGYDGEYGALTILRPEERAQLAGQVSLFVVPPADLRHARPQEAETRQAGFEMAASSIAESPADWTASDPIRGLDDEQRQAVTAGDGPVVVLAGPGAGKTRTLIQRIALLLRNGVVPESITAITFTHRAADELRQRLTGAAGQDARRVWVGTFHRFCLELLSTALPKPPLILDERETEALLAEAAPRGGKGPGGGRDLRGQISLLKSRGIHQDSPAVPPSIAEIYRRYQARLAGMEAYDYDDLLLATLDLIRADASLLRAAQQLARHLLVDEFQDLNAVQYHLVRLLAGDGAGLFVIGDPGQAIYGFRGASNHYFDQLKADFPAASTYRLRGNYRSAATIVQAAQSFATGGGQVAMRPGGQRLRYVAAGGARAEARAVVREIERLLGGSEMLAADRQSGRRLARTYSLGEIAVLFRTGRQGEPIEEALLAEGIPYRVLGRQALLAAPDVQEALDLIRYLDRPTDLRFAIALRGSRCNPGEAVLSKIRAFARANECSYTTATAELLRTGQFTIALHERLQGFLEYVAELQAMASSKTAAEMILHTARGAEGPSRALLHLARTAGDRTLSEFLARLVTGHEADGERREDLAKPGDGITLLTMHAAKGLEFPAVILAGLADGVVPWKGAEGEEELAEERRLFYVGLTRAAEALILLGPPREGGRQAPSRFLAEIPAELMEQVGGRRKKAKALQQGLF